jgi:surface antigen
MMSARAFEGGMPAIRFVTLALAGLSMAACSPDAGPREVGGAPAGDAIGNLLGGLFGNSSGAALDDEDSRRAYQAEMQALEVGPSGVPVPWRNPNSGRYGNVVPGPVYEFNGVPCRQFTHAIYAEGRPLIGRGTACRNPDGTWTIVG